MKFEDINNLLNKNEWYKVEGEERYLSTEDIYFRFELQEWSDVILDDIPNNLLNFMTQLRDVAEVQSVRKVQVDFHYDSIKLQSINLYLLSGKDQGQFHNRPINIFFSIPTTYKSSEKIENIFCLALIKFFNNEYSLGKIHYAIGEIE